jgi:hypothetical protein
MNYCFYIAVVVVVLQALFLLLAYRNSRYALAKYKRKRAWYRPRTVLIVPCKGLDLSFQENITSFFNQDYENYLLWFVVADKADPAYGKLCELKTELADDSKADDAQVLVAGYGKSCSQKIHNLLYCCEKIGNDVEVLAFADSDACVRTDWLSHLVYPLRQPKNGAASGYRWFIPKKNNSASLALSAVNAKVAQFLGNTRFNQAWGGSMAIGAETFRKVGLDKIWTKALSDDLSLSYAVKKAGLKIAFVPACLVASYESTTWQKLFEFGRRQLLITRISAPKTWWFGLGAALYSVLGLWGTVALAAYTIVTGQQNVFFFAAVPVLFFASQMARAILRQRTAGKLLEKDLPKMKFAIAADVLFFWLWSLLLLALIVSSAFGRTITWRRIRYKLLGPTETVIIGRDE